MTTTIPPTNTNVNTERRKQVRHKVNTKVRLVLPGKGAKILRASNLSAQGTFIPSRAMNLKIGDKVELVFIITVGNVDKLHRRTGEVKHTSTEGTGFQLLAMTTQQIIGPPASTAQKV